MKHKKSIRIISVLLCMILVLSCYPTESTLVFAKQKKTSNQMEYIVLSDSNEELLKIVYSVTDCRSSQKTVNIAITNMECSERFFKLQLSQYKRSRLEPKYCCRSKYNVRLYSTLFRHTFSNKNIIYYIRY